MKNLKNKVAFITGGASGIGLGMAKAFAGAGMKLAIADIDDKALAKAADLFGKQGVAVKTIKLDVRDRAAWDRVANEVETSLGPVEILCNSAGVGDLMPFTELSMPQWDWVMAVNLGGVINGVAVFLPRMLKRKSGHIVNTASDGVFRHPKNSGAYCVAKAGVINIAEGLRADLEGTGIGVTILLPGLVRTNIVDNFIGLRPSDVPATERARDLHGRLTSMLPGGLDPDIVGQRVLDAVEHDRFWLFTDPAGKKEVQERHREIKAGLEAAEDLAAQQGAPKQTKIG